MITHTLIKCFIISIGAAIMLISILGTRELMNSLQLVPQNQRKRISVHLLLHRILMVFFLCGYLVVLAAFIFQYSLISDIFISLIFFFGSVFVFLGVNVQTRLLSEIQNTLQGIIPICCSCKKIRSHEGNPRDINSWKKIEEFLTERINVNLSHGLCPECFEEEISKLH